MRKTNEQNLKKWIIGTVVIAVTIVLAAGGYFCIYKYQARQVSLKKEAQAKKFVSGLENCIEIALLGEGSAWDGPDSVETSYKKSKLELRTVSTSTSEMRLSKADLNHFLDLYIQGFDDVMAYLVIEEEGKVHALTDQSKEEILSQIRQALNASVNAHNSFSEGNLYCDQAIEGAIKIMKQYPKAYNKEDIERFRRYKKELRKASEQ